MCQFHLQEFFEKNSDTVFNFSFLFPKNFFYKKKILTISYQLYTSKNLKEFTERMGVSIQKRNFFLQKNIIFFIKKKF